MPITIAFTYDKVTHESASKGDVAERGFYGDGGWFYDADTLAVKADLKENPDLYWVPWTPGDLRSAIESARNLGIYEGGCGGWYSVDPSYDREYFEQGVHTTFAMHVNGCTPSTTKRIDRLLKR